jgi:uncharacterized Rossmann fold enzyme
MRKFLDKVWQNQRVYIVGGGPSIASLDINFLKDKNVIVTNNAYQLVPWAQILCFLDCSWYEFHKENLKNFKGEIITWQEKLKHEPNVIYLIGTATTSGEGAIRVAIKLGASEIILLGFDGKLIKGKRNYHDDHKKLSSWSPAYDLKAEEAYKTKVYYNSMVFMKQKFIKPETKVINCTPNSSLKCFPIESLEKWL